MKRGMGGLVVLGAVALGACDGSGEPDLVLDAELTEDVAMVAADAAMGDLDAMVALGLPGSAGPAGAAGAPPERSRTVTFFDASGNAMDAFDPLLTDRIHIVMEVAGEVIREHWSASVDRERDLTVSGLAGEETVRTWNGTSNGRVTRSRHGDRGERSYEMTEEGSVGDVVVAVDRTASPWPLSGTITRAVHVKLTGPGGEEERDRLVVIVFDGTQYPDMTVNGEPFELDLAARQGHRPFRRRGGGGGGG